MKRNLMLENNNEKNCSQPPKRLRMSQMKYETKFQEIPTEVIHKIVEYYGIIEKNVLRFVCKQLYQISHKCGSMQEGDFFFVHSTNMTISIFRRAKRFLLQRKNI
jgi:hypothetical protein